MAAQLWRHRPVVKEAIEYTGVNAQEIVAWAHGQASIEAGRLLVQTPHGVLEANTGDYVTRGIEGEFYPIPRTIFLGSYDPIGES